MNTFENLQNCIATSPGCYSQKNTRITFVFIQVIFYQSYINILSNFVIIKKLLYMIFI